MLIIMYLLSKEKYKISNLLTKLLCKCGLSLHLKAYNIYYKFLIVIKINN